MKVPITHNTYGISAVNPEQVSEHFIETLIVIHLVQIGLQCQYRKSNHYLCFLRSNGEWYYWGRGSKATLKTLPCVNSSGKHASVWWNANQKELRTYCSTLFKVSLTDQPQINSEILAT